MKSQLVSMAVILLTLMSCNSTKKIAGSADSKSPINTEINNTFWELTALEDQKIDQSTIEGKKIHFTLNSADNTINGYSGCNIFNGNYKLEDGGRISISQIASTRMACPDSEINENEILKVLELTDNYTINNGVLSLNVGRKAPLAVFKKVAVENQIIEKYWKLKTLKGKEVTMAENQEREIFFTLKSNENRLTGFSGCNTLSGEYTLEEGNRIRFSNIASTLRACPDVDVNESEVLNVFNTADNYTINGDILSLNVGRSAPLAVFEAVYM